MVIAVENKQGKPRIISIKDAGNAWEFSGLKYLDRIASVLLSKQYLLDGKEERQWEWIDFSKKAKTNGDFYVPNSIILFSIFEAVSNLKENPLAQDALKLIKRYGDGLQTLTKIEYNPGQLEDMIVHDIGLDSQFVVSTKIPRDSTFSILHDYEIRAKFGPDKEKTRQIIKALLGTNNFSEIEKTLTSIFGDKDIEIETFFSNMGGSSSSDSEHLEQLEEQRKCIKGFSPVKFKNYSWKVAVDCSHCPQYTSRSLGIKILSN
jgi:hypothetical protein